MNELWAHDGVVLELPRDTRSALARMATAVILGLFTLGFGSVLGVRIMPAGFTPWTIMIMAPGAFFVLGLLVWAVRARFPQVFAAPEKR